jgi:hypothetical protein
VRGYPGVTDAAVVADRSSVETEDEVKAWLTVAPDAAIDFIDLLRFCTDRLPHYMVPRFFEVTGEFPRTASSGPARRPGAGVRNRADGPAVGELGDLDGAVAELGQHDGVVPAEGGRAGPVRQGRQG